MFQGLGIKELHQRNKNEDFVECINGEYRIHGGSNPLLIRFMAFSKHCHKHDVKEIDHGRGDCRIELGKRFLTWAEKIVQLEIPSPAILSFKFVRQEYGFSHKTVQFSTLAKILKEVTSSKLFKECPECVRQEQHPTEKDFARRNEIHDNVEETFVNGLPCVYVHRHSIKRQTHRICPGISFAYFFKCPDHSTGRLLENCMSLVQL
ncbi:hypothetical protein QAD02_004205 [Eretmocerus hayati]|uniref:Uncharacterized protein n=1 Tax=Eretmocerus hayati TaxID=131215 RepID=A0ACC2NPD1_9HYME|nr:hypothetical protein QAD02_004205 [Eretmocerus hayati]